MVRRWIAVVVLILATSPLTAPFQTYDIGKPGVGSDAAPIALTTVTSTPNGIDPGSLVPPLSTQPGRLNVVPDLRLIVTHFAASSQDARLAPRVVTPTWSPGADPPFFTVLRL